MNNDCGLSSGCLRAAAISACVASLSCALPRPARSSTSNSKPPVVPSPLTEGGSKLSAKASGIASSFGRTEATKADAFSSGPRSLHGFRTANSIAEFDCAALVRKLRPLMKPAIWTPGVACKMSRTFCRHGVGALERRPVRQLHDDEEIALVLDRQEGGRDRSVTAHRRRRRREKRRRPAPSRSE